MFFNHFLISGYRKAAEFDGDWSIIHMDGMEALKIAYPQLFESAARKAFMAKFREAEGDSVTRITTTGENKMSSTQIFMTEYALTLIGKMTEFRKNFSFFKYIFLEREPKLDATRPAKWT